MYLFLDAVKWFFISLVVVCFVMGFLKAMVPWANAISERICSAVAAWRIGLRGRAR